MAFIAICYMYIDLFALQHITDRPGEYDAFLIQNSIYLLLNLGYLSHILKIGGVHYFLVQNEFNNSLTKVNLTIYFTFLTTQKVTPHPSVFSGLILSPVEPWGGIYP